MANVEGNSILNFECRLRGKPSIKTFEELDFGHSSLREIAPYALKIRQNTSDQIIIPTQQYFNYTAVVATIDDETLACVIFDFVDEKIISYAGHFITKKGLIFDPNTKEHVSDYSLLASKSQDFLSLFGVVNPNLVLFPDYFVCRNNKPYQELMMRTQDLFMITMQQQQKCNDVSNPIDNKVIYLLSEPLKTSFYVDTALPITPKSVARITESVRPIGSVKRLHGELGSFHPQTTAYCHPKFTDNATKINMVDNVDGCTTYYSAYEEPGLMSFFSKSFLLGSIRGHHIVGVVADDKFFIMATTRVYNRYSSVSPISTEGLDGTEVMKTIHLPSDLPLHLVVTMLELRQILRHPFMFPDEMEAITKSFGFGCDEMPANLSLTFIRQPGPKTMMERMQRTWVQQMLDILYTQAFQNSLCEFGETTSDSDNPSRFCVNVVRCWIKELLRSIHCDQPQKDDCKFSAFLRMTVAEFIQHYLSLFGLSPESCFTCHQLEVDGISTSLCETSIPAKDIGNHVITQHTHQIWIHGHFKPFSLSLANQFISLTNQTDVTPLENCKSIVDHFRGRSYMEALSIIDGTMSSSPPPTPPPLPEIIVMKKSSRKKKRKRLSLQEKIVFKIMREHRCMVRESFTASTEETKRTEISPPKRMTRSRLR